jgi:mannose-6-phosphate isomerase-like protein (cupin superfamily)
MFDTKIAIVLRNDLAMWQKLNVTAFLTSGIVGAHPGILGEPYEDAGGNTYSPLVIQPIIVRSAERKIPMTDQQTPAPAPEPGQLWHIPDIIKRGELFVTLLGRPSAQTDPSLLAIESMSLHVYHLKKGAPDRQRPHREDEAYYVVKGSGKVTIENRAQDISEGDLIFVPRDVRHHFHDYEELALLVFFAPRFTESR